jgi:hypothetical protein
MVFFCLSYNNHANLSNMHIQYNKYLIHKIQYTYNVYIQWNLSIPTHQGTTEMCQIVQDVVLRFYFS